MAPPPAERPRPRHRAAQCAALRGARPGTASAAIRRPGAVRSALTSAVSCQPGACDGGGWGLPAPPPPWQPCKNAAKSPLPNLPPPVRSSTRAARAPPRSAAIQLWRAQGGRPGRSACFSSAASVAALACKGPSVGDEPPGQPVPPAPARTLAAARPARDRVKHDSFTPRRNSVVRAADVGSGARPLLRPPPLARVHSGRRRAAGRAGSHTPPSAPAAAIPDIVAAWRPGDVGGRLPQSSSRSLSAPDRLRHRVHRSACAAPFASGGRSHASSSAFLNGGSPHADSQSPTTAAPGPGRAAGPRVCVCQAEPRHREQSGSPPSPHVKPHRPPP
jgi:hypothetical protein